MLKKILKILTIILASWGLLFIIILLIPDNEEDSAGAAQTVAEEALEEESGEEKEEASPGDPSTGDPSTGPEEMVQEASEEAPEEGTKEDTEAAQAETQGEAAHGTLAEAFQGALEEAAPGATEEAAPGEGSGREEGGNRVQVNIPESELGVVSLKFRSTTLDNKVVTEDIFKDYDLTLVHVWGTYCGPCIAEMGDYAELYRNLPDNVNLVGLVCDVYDGIDINVDAAHEILDDAGAEFTNIATSDSNYDLVSSFRYVPSSFFVNREGRIVGTVLEGVHFEQTKKRLDSYLE
ncbi:MAG: redoxin domain-containing protein [Lachnospiraceae bacterium]|nr:redoxin domain-containing protein [Lachnospiraceae bacterium]